MHIHTHTHAHPHSHSHSHAPILTHTPAHVPSLRVLHRTPRGAGAARTRLMILIGSIVGGVGGAALLTLVAVVCYRQRSAVRSSSEAAVTTGTPRATRRTKSRTRTRSQAADRSIDKCVDRAVARHPRNSPATMQQPGHTHTHPPLSIDIWGLGRAEVASSPLPLCTYHTAPPTCIRTCCERQSHAAVRGLSPSPGGPFALPPPPPPTHGFCTLPHAWFRPTTARVSIVCRSCVDRVSIVWSGGSPLASRPPHGQRPCQPVTWTTPPRTTPSRSTATPVSSWEAGTA